MLLSDSHRSSRRASGSWCWAPWSCPSRIYGDADAPCKAISRRTVLLLGFVLVAIAGFDVYVLRAWARDGHGVALAGATTRCSLSEVSLALSPAASLFAGLGINVHLACADHAPGRRGAALRDAQRGTQRERC